MSVVELEFTRICEGIAGSEGPVFDTNGNFYAVAPMDSTQPGEIDITDGVAGKLLGVNLDTGEVNKVCTPHVNGYGGRPCGCQFDKEGNIWVADMRLGILKCSSTSGEFQQISKVDSDGNALRACNDLVFDKYGNLWVTGPGSPIAPAKEDRINIFKECKGVLYFLPKGAMVPQKIPGEYFTFCNGIAIKDNLLLVAETMTQSIIAFDADSSGKLTNRRLWTKLPEAVYNDPMNVGGPDGMDFDVEGRLLVAHHGSGYLEAFSADGKLEKRIKCPFATPSNLHFKPDSSTCLVTEHDNSAVWKFEWECNGMPMYCNL